MTDKYYVLVAGNGETSRANIEALMDDHYYAHGPSGTLVLAFEKHPSKGQTFAAQFAKDKTKDIVVFCNEDAQTIGVPGATMYPTSTPYTDASQAFTNMSAFILWSDEDENSLEALKECKASNVPCFNLLDGLVPLNAVEGAGDPVKPVIPVQEMIAPKPTLIIEEVEEDSEELFEDEDEEDDGELDEMDSEEVLFAALSDIADIFADMIVEKLKNRLSIKPK